MRKKNWFKFAYIQRNGFDRETHYWLTVIKESGLITGAEIERLMKEANELTAIFASADKTAKLNYNRESEIRDN